MFSKSLLGLVLLACSASAHTIFQQIAVNGVWEARHDFMRLPSYNGPIEDVTSSAMSCNGGPNPLTKVSNNVKTVKAGDSITMQWSFTLDSALSGMVIDASHKGPVMAYLAKVPSATGPAPSSGWFKIYEDGYDGSSWAVDKLIANGGKVTVKIPDCIAPGDYLFRGELIALHAAGNYPGAQLYMECVQLRVTGGGSASPATVSFPGAYSGSDAGIKFNLYTQNLSYTIPGPRPFTCSGSNPGNPTNPGTTPTSTPPANTPTPTPTPPPATGGSIPKYAQCGGNGWSGSGTCVSGSTCVKSNEWYSQCL